MQNLLLLLFKAERFKTFKTAADLSPRSDRSTHLWTRCVRGR